MFCLFLLPPRASPPKESKEIPEGGGGGPLPSGFLATELITLVSILYQRASLLLLPHAMVEQQLYRPCSQHRALACALTSPVLSAPSHCVCSQAALFDHP